MNKQNTIYHLFLLSLFLLFGLGVQAQYFQAQKVSEDIKVHLNESHGRDLFTATSKGIGVYGQVFAGGQSVNMGLAFLFSYDTLHNDYSFYAATSIQILSSPNISYYYFDTVPTGVYTTIVALSIISPNSDQYAPTYLGNTFYWDKAQRFNLQSPGYNYVIDFLDIEHNPGSSSISGRVLEGSVKSPGDPIANAPLYLVDNNAKLRGYTQSDILGEYTFNNLSFGNYHVYTNLINYQIFPSVATTSATNSMVDSVDIYIGNGVVTSMEKAASSQFEVRSYPNPTTDFCFLDMNMQKESFVDVSVFDISGRKVLTSFSHKHLPKGKHIEKIDVKALANGSYFVVIDIDSGTPRVLQFIKN